MIIPKIFISYSHDSQDHKKWVLDFGVRIRQNGIDAILDQWDLKPGDDIPNFVESELAKSDFIILICTARYVQKANQGIGGVGYEKMIITSNLMSSISENKIIPIIRQSGTFDLPIFLKTKLFIDFSREDDFEFNFDELIRAIHNAPLYEKPKIGTNPFLTSDSVRARPIKKGINELMQIVVNFYEKQEELTYDILRGNLGVSKIYYEFLIKDALKSSYIHIDYKNVVYLTDEGKFYVMDIGLIK